MKTSPPWNQRKVALALAQFSMGTDPRENLDKALRYIAQAAQSKAQIVCLPELFRTTYFCQEEKPSQDFSEPLPGEVLPALEQAAKSFGIAIVGGSIYERTSEGQLFNTSMVIDANGKCLGTYRKVHIPQDPAFYECNYFKGGDQGFKVFDLGFAKISVLICYDQWFPEAARSCVLQGAEILFYPTAIGTNDEVPAAEGDWQEAWETVQRGHAIANSVVVAAVNRVGREGHSRFWGGSFVSDAFGKLLAKGDAQEQLLLVEVDLGHSRYTRDGWRFFESRRPDQYGAVSK